MAANGFIELLRLSKRGNTNYSNIDSHENIWSGVGFEILGQYFVAPLGEVSEVIYPPLCTPIPNAQFWVKGLANIRGKLLSVTELASFITEQDVPSHDAQKVICILQNEHYVGLVVDRVLGIQHFQKNSFFSNNNELDEKIKLYCHGYFPRQNLKWNIFLNSKLLNDPRFLNASKYR
ncbi:MAG: chemotaxis protein CheW [Candidatus Acinetobacter avistercoris]|uniref:chemotaxis protein CheW n=1 Tax=Acinetobacter sp. KS-LM10 TaxID=3120518 RepID=UPI001F8E707F|nr:chemotaxis protein CheW [Candidatus Acinetobacter avistercoris]